jgi:hypothetical protein
MISKEALQDVLRVELDSAVSRYIENNQADANTSLALFNGQLPAQSDDAKDATVSEDVAAMVEAVTAQMMPAFEDAGTVEFEATSSEDEAQARLESEIVRGMLIEGRNADAGFVAISEAIKDACLQRTAIMSVDVEERIESESESWEQLNAQQVQELITPKPGERIEIVGEIEQDEETGLYAVELERSTIHRALTMRAIARENFVTSSLEDRDPNNARFVAHRIVTDRASLIARGFDPRIVRELPYRNPTTYDGWINRNRSQPNENPQQFATETVEVWRCFALIADRVDSPEARRFEVWFSRDAGLVLADPIRCNVVCYGVGVLFVYPHRFDGISLADKLGQIQEIKTKVQRLWLDNFAKINRPRIAVDESTTNMADALDATADVVRTKGPPQVAPMPTADMGPSAQQALQHFDRVRTEMGGASLEMQTAAAQSINNQTASGIERQYSVKEQLAAAMARTLAETMLRSVFIAAHYLLRTRWQAPIAAKVGGQWVEVDPAQWPARKRVTVRVGQSVSERMRRAMALQSVMQMQAMIMQSPLAGQLTDPSRMFNAAADYAIASQLRDPDRYFLDPASPQAQQAAQAQAQAAQAQQAQQGALVKLQAMLEKYKIDAGTASDALEQIVKLAIEEAKLTMSPAPLDEAGAIAGAEAGKASAGKDAAAAAATEG